MVSSEMASQQTSVLRARRKHEHIERTQTGENKLSLGKRAGAFGLVMLAAAGCSVSTPNTTLPGEDLSPAAGSPANPGSAGHGTDQNTGSGETSKPNGNQVPQPGDIKEVDGITYVWTEDRTYGLGMYIDQRLQMKAYDDHNFYVSGQDNLPRVSVMFNDRTSGNTPNDIVSNLAAKGGYRGCVAKTSIAFPGASQAATLSCPDSDITTGYIDIILQSPNSNELLSIEITRSDDGSATFDDEVAAANALSPRVLG